MERKNMPFASAYFEMNWEPTNCLSEWRVSRVPVFGFAGGKPRATMFGATGPAQDVMPDIKQLTAVIRTQTTAIHKELDPPMALGSGDERSVEPDAGQSTPGPVIVRSGGRILAKPIYQVRPDLAAGVALRQDIRQAIMEGFFNDLFLFPSAAAQHDGHGSGGTA
jgi:hypothetical protein